MVDSVAMSLKPELLNAQLLPDKRLELLSEAEQVRSALDLTSQSAAGITFAQAFMLALIGAAGATAAEGALARWIERVAATTISTIYALEEAGLVSRSGDRGDKHQRRVRLENAGTVALLLLWRTDLPLPKPPREGAIAPP